MSDTFLTIKTAGQHELVIKKSQFICSLQRVGTATAADQFIAEIKKANGKANHNCFAYMIGEHDQIQRESDDGEPSGTAGVPILEVLKRLELHNVCAVVTRYFGGIKLGAGGLIRAYSNATSKAIEQVGIVSLVLQTAIQITVSYANLDKLNYYLSQQAISITQTDYTDQVQVTIAVDTANLDDVQTNITNLLAGQVSFKIGDESYHEVDMPLYQG